MLGITPFNLVFQRAKTRSSESLSPDPEGKVPNVEDKVVKVDSPKQMPTTPRTTRVSVPIIPEPGKVGTRGVNQVRNSSPSQAIRAAGGTPRSDIVEASERLQKIGLPEDAAILTAGFLRTDPGHVGLNRAHGKALYELERYVDARLAFERVQRREGPSASTIASIAQCYVREGAPQKALEILAAHGELGLQSRRGVLAKSQALRHLGRPAEAEPVALSLVCRGQTESPTAEEFIEYGLVLHDQKDYDIALPYLRLACKRDADGQLVELPPTSGGRYALDIGVVPLARALYVEGQHSENIGCHPFEVVCEQPRVARFLAGSFAELRRYEDAELMARVALSEEPGDPNLTTLLKEMLAAQRVAVDDPATRLNVREAQAKTPAERFVVALARREGPTDRSWEFLSSLADYSGPEAALPMYNAYYANAEDGFYALRLGEKLVDWQRLPHEGADPFDYKFVRGTALGASMLRNAPSSFGGARGPARAAHLQKRLAMLRANEACVNACLTAHSVDTVSLPGSFLAAVRKGLRDHRPMPYLRSYMGRVFKELPTWELPKCAELGDYFFAMGQAHGQDNNIGALRLYFDLAMKMGSTRPGTLQLVSKVLEGLNGQAQQSVLTVRNANAKPTAAPRA